MKTVIKITLIAFLWTAVIQQGWLGIIDTDLRLQMAHAWWTGIEEVQLPPDYQPPMRGDIRAGVLGRGGKRYIAYDVGQSMLILPGDWLGTQLHQRFPIVPSKKIRDIVVSFLIFVPLNVAAVVSCFWLLRLFDFQERIAALASITWLLCTTVLYYAQVHWQNNQLVLFVTLGYAAALAYVLRRRPHFALLSGLALGAALLIRMTSVIHILTVFMFFVGCIAYQSRDKFKVFQGIRLWIIGFLPLALLGRFFDYIRYGGFLTTGATVAQQQVNTDPIYAGLPEQAANFPFTNPPHVGILGVLFSPAKSIFIYDPLLLPGLVLGIIFWKKLSPYIQWYLVSCTFNLCLHLALTSRLVFWDGYPSWGARYHVTSVHLLLIPLIALFIERLLSVRKLTAWLLRGFLAVAIIVQFASVIMPSYLERVQSRIIAPETPSFLQFRLSQRLTNIACLLDSSLSQKCINKLSPDQRRDLEENNRVTFLPFRLAGEAASNSVLVKVSPIFFLVWGLALTLAIGTTVWFWVNA